MTSTEVAMSSGDEHIGGRDRHVTLYGYLSMDRETAKKSNGKMGNFMVLNG